MIEIKNLTKKYIENSYFKVVFGDKNKKVEIWD